MSAFSSLFTPENHLLKLVLFLQVWLQFVSPGAHSTWDVMASVSHVTQVLEMSLTAIRCKVLVLSQWHSCGQGKLITLKEILLNIPWDTRGRTKMFVRRSHVWWTGYVFFSQFREKAMCTVCVWEFVCGCVCMHNVYVSTVGVFKQAPQLNLGVLGCPTSWLKYSEKYLERASNSWLTSSLSYIINRRATTHTSPQDFTTT